MANAAGCVTRINNAAGNQVTNAIVLTNANDGRSWNFAGSITKNLQAGLSLKAAYSYGEAKTLIDPGSVAAGSFTGNAIFGDPNNPELAYAASSPGHRTFINATYTKQFFSFGVDERVGVLERLHQRQHQLRVLGRHERRHGAAATT